jgi:hypothetical protein
MPMVNVMPCTAMTTGAATAPQRNASMQRAGADCRPPKTQRSAADRDRPWCADRERQHAGLSRNLVDTDIASDSASNISGVSRSSSRPIDRIVRMWPARSAPPRRLPPYRPGFSLTPDFLPRRAAGLC